VIVWQQVLVNTNQQSVLRALLVQRAQQVSQRLVVVIVPLVKSKQSATKVIGKQ
jgi:hypothetical protein